MNWTTYIYWTLKVLVNSYRLGCIIWKDIPDFLAHILWILCPPLYWLSSGWQKWWSWIVESPYSRHSHPPLVMESYPLPSGTRPKSGMTKAECDIYITYNKRWGIQSNQISNWPEILVQVAIEDRIDQSAAHANQVAEAEDDHHRFLRL